MEKELVNCEAARRLDINESALRGGTTSGWDSKYKPELTGFCSSCYGRHNEIEKVAEPATTSWECALRLHGTTSHMIVLHLLKMCSMSNKLYGIKDDVIWEVEHDKNSLSTLPLTSALFCLQYFINKHNAFHTKGLELHSLISFVMNRFKVTPCITTVQIRYAAHKKVPLGRAVKASEKPLSGISQRKLVDNSAH